MAAPGVKAPHLCFAKSQQLPLFPKDEAGQLVLHRTQLREAGPSGATWTAHRAPPAKFWGTLAPFRFWGAPMLRLRSAGTLDSTNPAGGPSRRLDPT